VKPASAQLVSHAANTAVTIAGSVVDKQELRGLKKELKELSVRESKENVDLGTSASGVVHVRLWVCMCVCASVGARAYVGAFALHFQEKKERLTHPPLYALSSMAGPSKKRIRDKILALLNRFGKGARGYGSLAYTRAHFTHPMAHSRIFSLARTQP